MLHGSILSECGSVVAFNIIINTHTHTPLTHTVTHTTPHYATPLTHTPHTHYIHRPSINNADPEVETSLSSTLGTNSRHSAHRVTIDELHGLLEALDNARSAVQAQLDARMSKTGGR